MRRSRDSAPSPLASNAEALVYTLLIPIFGIIALLSSLAFVALLLLDFMLLFGFRGNSFLWIVAPAATLLAVRNVVTAAHAMTYPSLKRAAELIGLTAAVLMICEWLWSAS